MRSVLSVVVPIYNVATYLAECLSSIANQYHRDLEVIMVDDGSTDESARIAEGFAAVDPRFRLVRQPNRGLGAARNTGAAHATGDYLMFVDSDDVIPPYAAELLISAIERTGSDFASGNVYRLTRRGLHQSGMHKRVFAKTRLRAHVSRFPDLLDDRTAWNKVFRREFWDAHELRFPEGVLYEDAPVMLPAHVLARSVDVLDVPVYYWREREAGERSITQRRDEVKGFLDRLAGVISVSRFLGERGQARLKRIYEASALRNDLMIFMRVLPRVDDEYRQIFLDRCNEFLDGVDDQVLRGLPAAYRVLWTLTRHRMLPEMLEVIPFARDRSPITRRGLRRFHDLPFLDANLPQLPRSLYVAGTPLPRTRLHDVSWHGDRLRIRGHAFIPGQPAARAWSTSRLLMLREEGGRRTRRVPVRNRRCLDATADFGREDVAYDWSGFEVTLDPRTLRGADGQWRDGTWTLLAGVVGLGQKSEGPVEVGENAQPIRVPARYVADGVRVAPVVCDGSFTIRVERVRAEVERGRVTAGHIELEGTLKGRAERPAGVAAVLSRVPQLPWRSFPVEVSGDRFTVRIPVDELRGDYARYPLLVGEPGDRFQVELSFDDGAESAPLIAHPDFHWTPAALGPRVAHLHPDAHGRLVVALLPAGPVLTQVESSEKGFHLSGWIPDGAGDWSRMELVLRLTPGRETRAFPVEVAGDAWSVTVDPLELPAFGGTVRLREGSWDVLCRNGRGPVTQLPLAERALADLPVPLPNDPQRVTLEWLRQERAVVRVRPALADDERGVVNQARIQARVYPRLRRKPLRDAVLYDSFNGLRYSDTPRAVHEEFLARGLPLEHIWVVDDGQAAIPESARPVALSSLDWYEALSTCRYIVTNQRLPEWFRRREGQVVVQSWPGVPLSRIGFDVADPRLASPSYLENLARESANWSHLVSPNRFSTPILRRALRYQGEILEIGCPRNDILFADRDTVRARVRERLGLPADRTVVLYTPTWRDDEAQGDGGRPVPLRLDVERAAAQLGHDHVLLIRRHPDLAEETPHDGEGVVWDVSRYPDLADLLVLADILVTDYSSVMFDFANTGRPMLFFLDDPARHREEARGFYLDWEQEAPGPLLHTTDEVIAAIRDIDAVAERYAEKYRAFAARACDLDDGGAAARLVDRMLAAGRR